MPAQEHYFVCGTSHVYPSLSHQVQIRVYKDKSFKNKSSRLIQSIKQIFGRVIGCNMWIFD